jgi:hypothetical protein
MTITVRELLAKLGRGDVSLDDRVEVEGLPDTPPEPKRSLQDPCPHPAREGKHELYMNDPAYPNSGMHCRACGAASK